MSTISKRLLLASACITLILSGCNKPSTGESATDSTANATPSPSAANDAAVATVNGTPITVSGFNDYAARRIQPGSVPTPEESKAILNEMVSLELVVQDALKKGLDKKPDVEKTIENQRRMLLANAALREYVEAHPITDEQLKKEYDQRIAAGGTKELKARHILVKTEAEAKAIIAQLEKGADFAKLAKEKSTDSSAKEGGELGWFSPSQMVKPFTEAALALKKGEYTKTPVQSQFGWHIIQLEDVRDTKAPPFDQMKDRVRSFLQQKMSQEYIEGLKAAGKVEIQDKNLPIPPQPALKAPAPGGAAPVTPTPAPKSSPAPAK
ncbi:MAG: peptidylprolyl isomerase [Gammaproteobacteria bacterium]